MRRFKKNILTNVIIDEKKTFRAVQVSLVYVFLQLLESLKLGIEQNPWVKTIELGEPHTRLCFWHSFWETNNEGKSGATDTLYLFSFCFVLHTM